MSQVAVSAGAGAVAGLVGFYAFPVFLPTAGATLADFVIAGGMTGIVAGQAAESSALLFSGNGNQIISSFAQPDHALNNFAWGAVGGGIGYGVHSAVSYVNSSLSGLSEFSYPDEFSSPYATGQYMN